MKKIVYSLLVFIVISASSCEKFLEKNPLDFSPELTDYYNTPEKLESNIRSVYHSLQAFSLYGTLMHYRLGFEADEGYYARSSPTSGPHANDFTSGHSDINSFWRDLYSGVARANNFIANVDSNPSIDVDYRNRLRGEALFLRGYFYFMLVKTFGGVPLILEPLADVDNIDIPRATDKEVYDQILADMKEAETLVASIQEIGHGGRVNKSAVRGILARVCLYMAGYPLRDLTKYQEAKNWAYKVISDAGAGHTLNPSFSQIFINYAQDKYDPKESIWEVEFKGNGQDAFSEMGQVGYVNGPTTTSDVIGQGFGGVKATSKLFNIYILGDLRRDWTIASFTYSGTTHNFTGSYTTSVTQTYLNNREAGKFRREYETLKPKHKTQTPQNFPLLRYSDVLLMYAEADYETVHLGNEGSNGIPSDSAKLLVNQVRLRSFNVGGIKIRTNTSNPTTATNNLGFGINAGGSGYLSAPTITLPNTNPAGTTAGIYAKVSTAGVINFFDLERDPVTGYKMGSKYTLPNFSYVTITPTNGGTGARANARFYTAEEGELTAAELNDFRKAIQDERMREFAFETIRKGDLIRWGIFEFEMRQVANILSNAALTSNYYYSYFANVREKHKLWPIPAREMSLNRKLVQNPGW
ncbi:RagB/SusD domain protein [Pseudopedobacter saltans DSM 12145]|uniref:RagB/SusD domain protein n=1 Tax=Pseudopedobacter saltans (strain ATCC 51119 / DSM 12145 / JCM 21818 / CCUG 39354 / LMG 10337 / NBRC 100064 / NCIMB 13643) TaxID=762903 RepID=F0S8I4_PSESL|nr:RagB/SusD family nutrient uptake outer membrane protein [Pseudopedobacter saltans]ADY51268.1 RagB/SusD domain protein [Pseudopedobacter saltans DSM 12145]